MAARQRGPAPATQLQPLFASLEPRHHVRGRLRLRYRLNPGPFADAHGAVRAARQLDGVRAARANARIRALVIDYDPQRTRVDTLCAQLRDCLPPGPGGEEPENTWPAVVASSALLLFGRALPPLLRLHATLAVARPVFLKAARGLARRKIDSHVLEALAVSISTLQRDFAAADTTLFMLALGDHLEESIARRSDTLLRSLLRPDDESVWVERDGVEQQVAAETLQMGETVIVATGATIPVDGTVLGGEAQVNEAAMTGESAPVRRKRGDMVLSGTLVEEGRLRIYAEHVGRQTAAARIADYVESSLASKSQTQIEASKLADRLVPAVLALAGTTLALSRDWRRAAAVLQADYACALKLATPVAFKSAMHHAGTDGILVKGADVLEQLALTDTFVFDKTGTLTTGRLEVTDSVTFDRQFTPDELIFLAASVEEHYFHPLAIAVVEAARMRQGRHFNHKEVEFIAAHGVASTLDGKRIVVGSRHFVEEDEGIAIRPEHQRRIRALYRAGKTLLYIGYGGHLLGVLALRDTVRENAAATLAQLRALGARRLVMLTGDHAARAAELAHELGLDEFHAELLPEQKAERVMRMKAEGRRIAFVGDGINDAPALAGADVGFAMRMGADIARLTSDIVLLEDDFSLVAQARARALQTMGLIAANYRATVGINTGILAAAALGSLSPVAASILHNGTTIGILLRALLGHRQPPAKEHRP